MFTLTVRSLTIEKIALKIVTDKNCGTGQRTNGCLALLPEVGSADLGSSSNVKGEAGFGPSTKRAQESVFLER